MMNAYNWTNMYNESGTWGLLSPDMMATAVQKSGLNTLPNGNGLVLMNGGYGAPTSDEMVAATATTTANNTMTEDPTASYDGFQNQQQPQNEIGNMTELQQQQQQNEETTAEEPEIDIMINNVVCSFSVRCHLNLREIALNGINVEYRKENGKITMKLRRPYTTASIWSSGKVTCTGATSELQAKIAARRFARCLQKLGFRARFHNYRVVNVLGTCSMPFNIKINSFSERHKEADYEPELHPGVTYKLRTPKATLKIFSTGSVTVTAPSVADVQAAIEHIFPLVYEFRKERTAEDLALIAAKKARQNQNHAQGYSPTFEDEQVKEDANDSDWD